MTTVVGIINLALKDAGVLGVGETASADDLSDSFETLKQMVGQWQIDGLMIYAQSEVSFSPNGAQSYTIGSGGTINTTRPSEIIGAFWREGTTDHDLDVLTSFEDYQRIATKSDTGSPDLVCYDPDYALGTLYVWPKASTGTIHLTVRSPLPTYATTSESLAVPAEYELALRYSLAELLAPSFQLPLNPKIERLAMRARKIIKRNNLRIPSLSMPAAILAHGGGDIISG